MYARGLLAIFWPARTYQRAAVAELAEAGLGVDGQNLWPEVRGRIADIPRFRERRGPGLRLLLEYVRWSLALYRTLLEQGVEPGQALQLIEKIQWRILEPLAASSFMLSRLRSSRLMVRVRWTLDTSFAILFTRPYERQVLVSTKGPAFNVTRCPFAEYLKEQGAPELTGAALCAMDNHMASQWGVELHRGKTIATGSDHCDFRFVVPVDSIGGRKPRSKATSN